jgi:hypothetical protein
VQEAYTRRVSVPGTADLPFLESSGSALTRTHPELILSKQKCRQVEGITLVRTKREEQKQNLAFSSRPFVLCGLPVRQPPKGQLLFERRNGRFLLQITGHPQYGLPFGQDRLVPIYLANPSLELLKAKEPYQAGRCRVRLPARTLLQPRYDAAVQHTRSINGTLYLCR